MQHEFYSSVNWDELMLRKTNTPYTPVLKGPTDTSHFDKEQTKIPIFSPPKTGAAIQLQENLS